MTPLTTHDLAQFSQRQHEVTAPVSEGTIEFFLGACVQSRLFFEAARPLIKSQHFVGGSPVEQLYGMIWTAMCQAADGYGGCTYDILMTLVTRDPAIQQVPPELYNLLIQPDGSGLLYSLFLFDPSPGHLGFARDCLRDFLYERSVVWPTRRLVTQSMAGHPTCLPDFLKLAVEQRKHLEALGNLPSAPIAIDRGSPMQAAVIGHRSGVDYIDRYIGVNVEGQVDGANVEGDVIGMLGPIGGGKTGLLVQLLVTTALTEYTLAVAMGRPIRRSILVTLEETHKQLWPRIMSCAAKIPKATLERIGGSVGWNDLSTPDNLKEYERHMWHAQEEVLCERQRYDNACHWLKQSLSILDLSGCGEFPQNGSGGVPEIAALVDRELAAHNQTLAAAGIDYAGLQCKRMLEKQGKSERDLRLLLSSYGNQCKTMIAEPHRGTVWVLHQLKPDTMKYRPTKLIDWSDSADCRSFAENMQVCGCLGPVERATGCRRLNWSKLRRVSADGVLMPILRMHSHCAYFYDASAHFVADERTGRFLDPQTMAQVGGGDQAVSRDTTVSVAEGFG